MDQKDKKVIEKVAEKLFKLLGVSSSFLIAEIAEGIEITLETEENGILIGYHGETLEALQLVLSLCIAKELGKFIRVSIEVGEYKKNRMDYLQNLVSETKEKVLVHGQPVSLPNLKSWERRFVHMLIQEDGQITSESSGEGRDRVLTVYPK
jgi:spoIIIJ-associated protein